MLKTRPTALTDLLRSAGWVTAVVATAGACHFDPAYRDVVPDKAPLCTLGEVRCDGAMLQTCSGDQSAPSWQTTTDCSASGQTCVSALSGCGLCTPADGGMTASRYPRSAAT